MDYQILADEITNDPLARGYSGMTDEQVTDSLNLTIDRDVNRENISGSEAWNTTVSADYAGLTDAKKSEWLSFCGIESNDPFGAAVQVVVDVFGGGSDTAAALDALRVDTVSRAVELFGVDVIIGDVQNARAL